MSKNFKKMLSYYKPYRGIFWADMFFATVSAAVALAIPLVIRYVTYTLVYEDKAVSYTHLRAHETGRNIVCRLLLEKKKNN